MSQRGEGKFKQREVSRAIRAIEAEGHVAGYVEVTKDGFRVGIRQRDERQEATNGNGMAIDDAGVIEERLR